jgi:hypothetical protein
LCYSDLSGVEIGDIVGFPGTSEVQAIYVNFNLYGWRTSVTENLNSWFGGELDLGGLYGSLPANFLQPAVPIITHSTSFLFGPHFAMRRHSRLTPFAHVLVGGVHMTNVTNQTAFFAPSEGWVSAGTRESSTAFAVSPGAGLDVQENNRMALRVIQVDYVMSRLYQHRQDSGEVSFGVMFNFGEK